MYLYSASVREPSSTTPHTISASSETQLNSNIRLRINALTCKTRNSAIQSLLVIWLLIFITGGMTRFYPIGILFLLPLFIAYIRNSPYEINPIIRTYHYWRCLVMWNVELARRTAPGEQI